MPDQPRCVWLTREQVEFFNEHERGGWQLGPMLHTMWNAAPADPVEALVEWFFTNFITNFTGADEDPDFVRNGATEILRALGMPDAPA